MITELREVSAEIIGGRKIDVVRYNLQNYRLHQVLEQLARLQLFLIECDSNNTSSKARPRDIRRVTSQFRIAREELEFSMSHNDLPSGIYEYAFCIYLVDQKEIQKVRNVKVKRVVSEVYNTCRVILSVDSSRLQSYISQDDHDDIELMFNTVDDCIARWMGAGADASDTGIVAPAYEELGVLMPDVDADYAAINEPSADAPLPKLPDTPDTEVKGLKK